MPDAARQGNPADPQSHGRPRLILISSTAQKAHEQQQRPLHQHAWIEQRAQADEEHHAERFAIWQNQRVDLARSSRLPLKRQSGGKCSQRRRKTGRHGREAESHQNDQPEKHHQLDTPQTA